MCERGLISGCLEATLKKSCSHCMPDSFNAQLLRLKNAGYPSCLVVSGAKKIIKK